jgi:hypothetical protein
VTVSGGTFVMMRLKAIKNSFHVKIRHSRIADTSQGSATGSITITSSCQSLAPSIRAASIVSYGRFWKKERIMQITRGSLIAV